MIQFKYISSLTIDELEQEIVIPCIDENGFSCLLIKNSQEKIIRNAYSTDNLDVLINRKLTKDNYDFYVHIIKAKKKDAYSKIQFDVIYEYIFRKITDPVADCDLSSLITSLEDYFKTTPDKNKRDIQVGVFGELLTIKNLYDLGYKNIINKYHKNFYSKHDIEISSQVRMEIKTTTSEKRIHHFKHNQIKRTDVGVIVSSCMLEEAKEGVSLFDLFNAVISLYIDADSIFALKKLMVKCGVDEENKGLSFSFEKALDDIRYFDVVNLPKIDIVSFDGVSNIEYDVDCSNCKSIDIKSLIKTLKDNE